MHDILEGKADVMEEEGRFLEEIKLREVKKEIQEREQKEALAKGRPGKGFKGNFLTFCLGCHTEYHHEAVQVCNNCGKDTISHDVSNTGKTCLISSEKRHQFKNFLEKFGILTISVILI